MLTVFPGLLRPAFGFPISLGAPKRKIPRYEIGGKWTKRGRGEDDAFSDGDGQRELESRGRCGARK